jgi:hypothetical protein
LHTHPGEVAQPGQVLLQRIDRDGEQPREEERQRRHDALLDAGLRLLRSGTLPESGGVPVTILTHLDADEVAAQRGKRGRVAVTAHGALLGMDELLRLAGEAQLVSVLTTATGGVLSYGQTRRLASCGQRQALAARDRGWTVVMRGGVPEWTPPPWLDPDQAPRHNTAHHITHFDFELCDTG